MTNSAGSTKKKAIPTMKKPNTEFTEGKAENSASHLIDARIKELNDWRGETLAPLARKRNRRVIDGRLAQPLLVKHGEKWSQSELKSGGREIRTLGELPHAGFQDRCNRPLCHPS